MKQNLIAAPLQHHRFQIVVENRARLTIPRLESMHVSAQKVLHRLVKEKLQIEGTRIRQRDHEARQGAAGPPHQHMTEMRPVDLRLLTREDLQT
jgi:hypothetical protein